MPYINVIDPEHASGRLAAIYDKVRGPKGQVDHVLQIHSLRPHSLEGHMALYKAVLHHPRNAFPVWFLECVGVLVSLLNDCDYCARHHSAGLERLLRSEGKDFQAYRDQLDQENPAAPFSPSEQAALAYARKLTLEPGAITPDDIDALRSAGLSDGEILEVNQVTGYFAYANRTVTGLGVEIGGETLGLAPDDSEERWSHA